MAKTILALGSLLPQEMEALESHFGVIRLWKEEDPEGAIRRYQAEVQALLSTYATPVSRRLIEALPNLEIIAQFGVGVENIDLAAAREKDIAVTNTPDVLTDDTADIALALILAVTRRVVEADMYVRVGKWPNAAFPLSASLGGKTVGIVGLGRIGQAVAKRCEAFGLRVVYHGPREKADQPYKYYKSLQDMARACDILVVCCAVNAATEGMIDCGVLEALGPKGVLINVARGAVVKEGDLVAALHNRALGGAGLDVYAQEPHVPEGLKSMDNVVLLPHIGSATLESRSRMGQLVVENLLAHFRGAPLKTPVRD